jgi:hypothetical protein
MQSILAFCVVICSRLGPNIRESRSYAVLRPRHDRQAQDVDEPAARRPGNAERQYRLHGDACFFTFLHGQKGEAKIRPKDEGYELISMCKQLLRKDLTM